MDGDEMPSSVKRELRQARSVLSQKAGMDVQHASSGQHALSCREISRVGSRGWAACVCWVCTVLAITSRG